MVERTNVLPFRNSNPTPPPPFRGRLLRVGEVHSLLDGAFSVDWIYKNLQAGRRKLSTRCVRWREYDVIEWVETGVTP